MADAMSRIEWMVTGVVVAARTGRADVPLHHPEGYIETEDLYPHTGRQP